MRFVHWVAKGVGVLSLVAGSSLILLLAWDEKASEWDLIAAIIGISIILLALGLLLVNTSKLTHLFYTLGRDTQQLVLKTGLYGLVGALLIVFWWYLIEKPKIEHVDIRKACEWGHRNRSDEFRSSKVEECYSAGVLHHK